MCNMKKMIIPSVLESIGAVLLGAAWMLYNGKVHEWWYYPIQITIIALGLIFIKKGGKLDD